MLLPLVTVWFSFCIHANPARQDSTVGDTVRPVRKNPRTATICSAIVPGMGQVYNGKYWKVPLVYGAGGAMIYMFHYNQSKYVKFRDAYINGAPGENYIIDGRKLPYERLTTGRDWYRNYRDLSAFGIAAVYLLNIVDAMVDAYFTNFDVSDDLTFRIQPAVVDNFDLTAAYGVKFSIAF